MLDLKKVLTIPSVTNQPDVLETFGGMQVKPSQLENDFELQLLKNVMDLVKAPVNASHIPRSNSEMHASQFQAPPVSSSSYMIGGNVGINLAEYRPSVQGIQSLKQDHLQKLAGLADFKRNTIIAN